MELPAEPADGRTGHDHGTRGDGRARVLLRYADPAWLVRLVLGLGGGARILEPVELAAEVARTGGAGVGQGRRADGNGKGAGDDGCRRGAVAFAAVVALLLVLAVRPHVRRLARSVAVLRADTAAGILPASGGPRGSTGRRALRAAAAGL